MPAPKKDAAAAKDERPVEPFCFPDHGITIMAPSLAEAEAELKKRLEAAKQ